MLVAEKLTAVARRLSKTVDALRFGAPVAHVYNPLDYAFEMQRQFIERYAQSDVPNVLLGMNPGPWGMMQTGVPFGEVAAVRDWLRLDAAVRTPRAGTHPKRPVLGLACTRSEVSGKRLWGWAARRFENPDAFFQQFYVLNYCPLAFLAETGGNITPDKLAKSERDALQSICDAALRESIVALGARRVIGIGAYATRRATEALRGAGAAAKLPGSLSIHTALHPSPASPAANRGWEPQFERDLRAAGVELP